MESCVQKQVKNEWIIKNLLFWYIQEKRNIWSNKKRIRIKLNHISICKTDYTSHIMKLQVSKSILNDSYLILRNIWFIHNIDKPFDFKRRITDYFKIIRNSNFEIFLWSLIMIKRMNTLYYLIKEMLLLYLITFFVWGRGEIWRSAYYYS